MDHRTVKQMVRVQSTSTRNCLRFLKRALHFNFTRANMGDNRIVVGIITGEQIGHNQLFLGPIIKYTTAHHVLSHCLMMSMLQNDVVFCIGMALWCSFYPSCIRIYDSHF